MKKARRETSDSKILTPLDQEDFRWISGGLLAFPFIQQAMQGTVAPAEPAPGQEPHG